MIEIICRRGAGDKEMDSVDDPLINTNAMAVKRGTYEIDRQWFLIHDQTIEVPHKKRDAGTALMDNDIVELEDLLIGLTGKRKIKSLVISGSPSRVIATITVAKYREFV